MIENNHTSIKNKNALFWMMISAFSLALIMLFFTIEPGIVANVVIILLGVIGAILIFRLPIIGLSLVILSTVVADILPPIPLLTSLNPLIGLLTIFAYFANGKYRKKINWDFSQVEIIGLLFIFWIFITHPQASLFGETRSWILTFAQLWVLLWLSRQFVVSISDHHILMVIVVIGISISAIVAIQQVGSFQNLIEGYRAEGLAGGANTAARYFLFGIILLFHLQEEVKAKLLLRLILILVILVLTVGLFLTESRSGVVLLMAFAALQVLPLLSNKRKNFFLIIAVLLIFLYLINLTDIEILTVSSIFGSIVEGTDTIGYRYELWDAGLKMALDNPLFGVGIGRFGDYLPAYWDSISPIRAPTPHNTYIGVLAETGILGLLFFLVLLGKSVINYLRAILHTQDSKASRVYKTWFILFIILLIGAFTKTDLTDKMMWFLIGLSSNAYALISQENISDNYF